MGFEYEITKKAAIMLGEPTMNGSSMTYLLPQKWKHIGPSKKKQMQGIHIERADALPSSAIELRGL